MRKEGLSRECGGTAGAVRAGIGTTGLSPRVRGNPRGNDAFQLPDGSIPASAGGTGRAGDGRGEQQGLSPRVRGNRRRVSRCGNRHGSIPASAGEPRASRTGRSGRGVYPRECGGTSLCTCCLNCSKGLSPRVRGNQVRPRRIPPIERSIPASAGEPRGETPLSSRPRVYPRECGGTLNVNGNPFQRVGLSPRVRGNLVSGNARRFEDGSIPASAGEPELRRC